MTLLQAPERISPYFCHLRGEKRERLCVCVRERDTHTHTHIQRSQCMEDRAGRELGRGVGGSEEVGESAKM